MTNNENYTIGSYEHNFHQFSFSSYDEEIDEWKPGVEIKGKKIPTKIEGDEITIVVNEPNIYDRPWYETQTKMLMGFYKPMIKPLAEKYGLKQLHISIEPNQYGSVMLALTAPLHQKAELQCLIERVFMNAGELRCHLSNGYEDFIIAHDRLNGEWGELTDYESADEYVQVMKQATECAGYQWNTDVEQEHIDNWNEENKVKEEA